MTTKPLCLAVALGLLGIAESSTADSLEIKEWLVPWEKSRPRDPYVDKLGRVWFVGQRGHYVANLEPETGEFNRYDLEPGTGPHNLIVGDDLTVWYAGNLKRHIGRLDTATGRITKIEMPDSDARDPHTLTFDSNGDIWFTVQQGNFVGKLTVASSRIRLIEMPTRKSRPYGIALDSNDVPWVVEFGSNKLVRIDVDSMAPIEIELPRRKARPRRLAITSDDRVWWVDYALGLLGRYDPVNGEFTEWPLPSGDDSRPYGMAADKHDRLWVVETGVSPNRFVGFDTRAERFLEGEEVPSGGGTIRHMYYHEPAGEVWFGTDTNYVGRAKVH